MQNEFTVTVIGTLDITQIDQAFFDALVVLLEKHLEKEKSNVL